MLKKFKKQTLNKIITKSVARKVASSILIFLLTFSNVLVPISSISIAESTGPFIFLSTGTNDYQSGNTLENTKNNILSTIQVLLNKGYQKSNIIMLLPPREVAGNPMPYNAASQVAQEQGITTIEINGDIDDGVHYSPDGARPVLQRLSQITGRSLNALRGNTIFLGDSRANDINDVLNSSSDFSQDGLTTEQILNRAQSLPNAADFDGSGSGPGGGSGGGYNTGEGNTLTTDSPFPDGLPAGESEIVYRDGKVYLKRYWGEEQIVKFKYETLDEFTPHSNEFVPYVRSQLYDDDSVPDPVGGSDFIGPHEAGNDPNISDKITGLPVVVIIGTSGLNMGKINKYMSASPMVIRITGVNNSTTIDQAVNTANEVAALGLPAGTIVVYGNELNNLDKEWLSRAAPSPGVRVPDSEVEEAAEKYANLFNSFAPILRSAGLRPAVAPADLYNSVYSGEAWINKVKSMGSYDTATANVINAYEIPDIFTIQGAVNRVQELTGKAIDFVTEIGPHPDKTILEHVQFLNQVSAPINSRGESLRASTLIPNDCNLVSDPSTRGSPDPWLYYVDGSIYDQTGKMRNPNDCSIITSLFSQTYDAVTVSGMVVTNIPVQTEQGYYAHTVGLEGYLVLGFEHIEFGEAAYFNWSHATTTNKNGKFAIPIDLRTQGSFVVILKPTEDGFRLVNSYDIYSLIKEDPLRRPENGIVTLGEVYDDDPVYTKEIDEYLNILPEFVSVYSKDYETEGDNYYQCQMEGDEFREGEVPWDNFNRSHEVEVWYSDSPYSYEVTDTSIVDTDGRGSAFTFEIFDSDLLDAEMNSDGNSGEIYESSDKTRTLECIERLNIPSSVIAGSDDYFDFYEGTDGQGTECFKYNEPFLPLTDKYFYPMDVLHGLANVSYLKPTTYSTSFYNGPSNYINQYQSNSNTLPSCDEFTKQTLLKSDDPVKNRYTYAGLSNLNISQTTQLKIQQGELDETKIQSTPACVDSGVIKTFGDLNQQGLEVFSKFHLSDSVDRDSGYTQISTIIDNDNIKNEGRYSPYYPINSADPPFEAGRSNTFTLGSDALSLQPSATWTRIYDANLENRNIFGDASAQISNPQGTGFYHNYLTKFAEAEYNNKYIFEIGPQRSLCEVVVNTDNNGEKIFIENSQVDLAPNTNPKTAYAGWLIDNKNYFPNHNQEIGSDPDVDRRKWLQTTFFGETLINKNTIFQKIQDQIYFTFRNYIKVIPDPDGLDTAKDSYSLAEFITMAHSAGKLVSGYQVNFYDRYGDPQIPSFEDVGDLSQYIDKINNFCDDTCENILWTKDECVPDENYDPITGSTTVTWDRDCQPWEGSMYKFYLKTRLRYVDQEQHHDPIKIRADDTRLPETTYQESRSLNDSTRMMTDAFKIPTKETYKKPYEIGKKRLEIYGFLEDPSNYETDDGGNVLSNLIAGFLSWFGLRPDTNPGAIEDAKILTHIKLVNDIEAPTTDPASSNLDWLRKSMQIPNGQFRSNISEYNPVIYRDTFTNLRLLDRFGITAGQNQPVGDDFGDGRGRAPVPGDPTLIPPRPDLSKKGTCPVPKSTCSPRVSCYSYITRNNVCRHGSNEYWENIGSRCAWPIPAYNFRPPIRAYAPVNVDAQIFCNRRDPDDYVPEDGAREQYGYAMDVVAGRSCDNLVVAPEVHNTSSWRVTSVNNNGESHNSWVALEGRGSGGTYKMYLYHLDWDSITVSIGDVVNAGQQLAKYSNTARHVHIEMAINDTYVRPEDYLWECYQ